MKTTIHSDLIPQMTFVGGKRPDGLYHWRQSAYASVRGTKHLLATAIGYLEVSNDGGYIIAPPSVVKGSTYQVLRDRETAPIVTLPPSLDGAIDGV